MIYLAVILGILLVNLLSGNNVEGSVIGVVIAPLWIYEKLDEILVQLKEKQ